MTLATKLTDGRIIAIPFFVIAFCWRPEGASLAGDWGKVVAAVIFIIASITDYYDGYLARRFQEVTAMGKFLDPIADKLLVTAALVCMVQYKSLTYVSAWMAILIIAREFAVTGLRLIAIEHGEVIAASKAGKWKTGFQLTAIITSLCLMSLQVIFNAFAWKPGELFVEKVSPSVNIILMLLAVFATIYSGYDYFKQNRDFLAK